MRHYIICIFLFIAIGSQAQQVNPVPDYVFRNQMSVGRNAVTDTAAYISIGPRYGANKGLMPPMVIDTASMNANKRNGLLIFSIQKNKYLYWDSVGAKWAEMAGTGGAAITGSGVAGYMPEFTTATNIDTTRLYHTSGRFAIGTTTPISTFQIGNANFYPSVDPVFLVSRNVNNDGGMSGVNGHSISEASVITRSGDIAFAGIENRAKFSGTNNFDHYVGFQNGLNYRSTGTLSNYYGYYDQLFADSGTITNVYGIYLQDAAKAASATITNNYGIYIQDKTAGTNDWTIYSNSTAKSYLKGILNVSKIVTNETNTAATPTAEIEILTESGNKADLRLYQLGNNFWDIQIPASQTYLSIGDIAGTYVYFLNGGDVLIGSATDVGAFKLQITGNTYVSGEHLIGSTSDQGSYALQVTGAAYFSSTLRTGAPSGGSVQDWRLGEAATVSPTSPNRTLRVEVGGTVYYLHAKTTND